ncbi:MAG: 4'-phosphopantetheinyl transferase superfamily protein [Firmicutes bacterium]|jgi:4'-phosphopantetheinyl transferase family protein|nr:4'-phosphopantetheinyl transferase superfamily protein [Bacillota bacterium]
MYKLFTKENTTSKDLLKDVLKNELNITNYELTFNKYNKPYLKDSNIYFNISHDKNTTILVISDKEIGVDIEYYTYKESVMKKYYNEFEQQEIINSNNKEYEFTRIWVMKEAFVKMKGQGISYGLQNVDTTRLKKQIKLISNEKYIIAICQSEE